MTEPLDLDLIKQRLAKATAGGWDVSVEKWQGDGRRVGVGYFQIRLHVRRDSTRVGDAIIDEAKYNAEFIAHARTDIPALIEEVERLRREHIGLERERDEQLERALHLDKWAWELRAKWVGAKAEVERLQGWLAECYRLSGADPDGNEDWRLAPNAAQEVRRLREESDETEARNAKLEAVVERLRVWADYETDGETKSRLKGLVAALGEEKISEGTP